MSVRFGFGFDAHRLVEGRPFIIGGVRIPFERGPLGHSDGDALTHAVADALLGAGNLGDLGALFPSSDARWKDADSLVLLEQCAARVRQSGFQIVNVDATVVVERPRLSGHLAAMAQTLARVLGISAAAVSVKAKTSDGMGYTGDGSGVAAYAVAALEQATG
jgi:2-C-methyl-D-erythritol 2,4-cyclodiphosphate synthase